MEQKYYQTTATQKILNLSKRIRAIAGGASASKTISILLYLIARAQTDKKPTITSIVSETFPHLRKGAMRDFLDILKSHNYFIKARWNSTDSTYTFETGSVIEFFSADQPGKVRGPRRDRLFVNEVNNVPQEVFEQLVLRTREFVFCDWNPVAEFYMYTDYIGVRDDVDFLVLTYKDNEALDEGSKRELLARKHNKNWWRVYGLGQLGEVEDRVYSDWQMIDEIPHEARLERRGLDFGYSVDPTAIVDVYYYNGGYILDERLYRTGMLNRQIADFLKNLNHPNTLIVADCAEPKSIDELRILGLPIIPCEKGKNSVKTGIDYVQSQRISVTKNSVNLLKEYRGYLWQTTKDGKKLDIPIKINDHLLDAVRYALFSFRPRTEKPKIHREYDPITGRLLS